MDKCLHTSLAKKPCIENKTNINTNEQKKGQSLHFYSHSISSLAILWNKTMTLSSNKIWRVAETSLTL